MHSPASGAAEAIGEYTAGCLRGAERLEISGANFDVMRASRRRNFGHPLLVQYLRSLASFTMEHHSAKILIGDMAQARGGPTMSKHMSHQSGLDVDIWFTTLPANKKLSARQRERMEPEDLVDRGKKQVNSAWKNSVADMIRFTAGRPEISRILVNPILKRELCKNTSGDRSWLGKIRPWWGHSDHMHVRLACPKADKDCTNQDPPPQDEECGATLDWWFSQEAEEEFKKILARIENPVMPKLPEKCLNLLHEK